MSSFTGPLITEWLDNGKKRLCRSLRYDIGKKKSGVYIEAEEGFDTDLTSIPWWIRWLIRKEGAEAPCSVIHDKGYASGVLMVEIEDPEHTGRFLATEVDATQAIVDSIYREAMRVPRKDGTLATHPARREMIYWGLVLFGFIRWRELRHASSDREWSSDKP